MGNLFLQKGKSDDTITISNYFIDEYMPKANGEFVKIYLHLLRCATQASPDLSLGRIADTFSCTEGDVTRALKYWEELGLLTLAKDNNSNIKGICLEGCRKRSTGSIVITNATPIDVKKHNPITPNTSAYEKPKYTSKDLAVFQQQEDVSLLLFTIESYLGKTLSKKTLDTILFFYDELNFSTDLIEYLVEYCVDNDKKSMRYIETVALSWADEGICTIKDAKAKTSSYNKKYYLVLKSMGIYDRGPTAKEREYIDTWTNQFGFNTELIIEACNKTLATIHKPNFNYINSILEDWKKSSVNTLGDIEKLDKEHKSKVLTDKLHSNAIPSVSPNGFNNFEQRTYDFDELEKQLLTSRK